MKKTPAQRIREYLRRKYNNVKEKKDKKGTVPNYEGAIYLNDIKRVKEHGKKKSKKDEDK